MSDQYQIILDRLEQLEATNAVRHSLNRYMEICDVLDANTDLNELMDLFTEDAIWEGIGKRYAKSFGQLKGKDMIHEMFRAYTQKDAHFVMNAHFVNSEQIQIQGNQAFAKWMMLQTSSFQSGQSHLNAAKLSVDFKQQDGHWKISHFRTENIFSRTIERWTDEAELPVPTAQQD